MKSIGHMIFASTLCIMGWSIAADGARDELMRGPRPKNSPQSWLSTNDIPKPLSVRGRTLFTLTVDASGLVQNCEIAASAGSHELDQILCRSLSARAKFYPAQDSGGSPAVGYYHSGIFWRPENRPSSLFVMEMAFALPHSPIPQSDPRSWISPEDVPASLRQGGTTKLTLSVRSGGEIKSCAIIVTSGSAAVDEIACQLISKRVNFLPARDAQGRAVDGVFPMKISWQR